jgi:AmmeMemoRadiSam system protein A
MPGARRMPAWEAAMHDPDPNAEQAASAGQAGSAEPHPHEHLLDLARASVVAAVDGRPAPVPDARAQPALVASADAFVTLTVNDDLRGCMGTLGAEMPLGDAVVRAAGMAATRDPRFPPVAAPELPGISIEVSVLSRPRPLANPGDFVPGRDGIVVEARGRRALLLPQVATEMGWGTTEMLDAVCAKAGLPADAWRERTTRLEVFEVERASGPLLAAGEPASSRGG